MNVQVLNKQNAFDELFERALKLFIERAVKTGIKEGVANGFYFKTEDHNGKLTITATDAPAIV